MSQYPPQNSYGQQQYAPPQPGYGYPPPQPQPIYIQAPPPQQAPEKERGCLYGWPELDLGETSRGPGRPGRAGPPAASGRPGAEAGPNGSVYLRPAMCAMPPDRTDTTPLRHQASGGRQSSPRLAAEHSLFSGDAISLLLWGFLLPTIGSSRGDGYLATSLG
ncbi:unnamed protein product [Diplocarpon coronariae]